MLTCSFSVSHLIKHDKTPLWTQRCLTIEPPVGKIGNTTSSRHPLREKVSYDYNLCPFLTLTQPPSASCLPSHICLFSLNPPPGMAKRPLKERSFGHTWWGPQWEKPRFVVYLIHWQLRKLENEDWFQGIAVLVKEDKCQTESDCFCDDNWSTLHSWAINILQTPNSIPVFWITIYLDGS